MAYRLDGTDDYVEFLLGAMDGYTMGPVTGAVLVKMLTVGDPGVTTSWDGLLTFTDGGGTTVLNDLIELNPAGRFAFWNGRTSGNLIDGNTTGGLAGDTTNYYVIVCTWGGANTAPRYHWKPLGAGAWTHESLADGTGADSLALTEAGGDRIIIGTDPSGGDDCHMDIVWAGLKKSNVGDVVTSLDTLDFDTVIAFGWDWLVGFEDSGTVADRSTDGTGDEESRSGTTLVADPTGWSWGGGGTAHALSATIAAVSTMSADLALQARLAATIAAVSTTAAALRSDKPLSATVNAVSTVSAALRLDASLAAQIDAVSTMAAALQLNEEEIAVLVTRMMMGYGI